MYDTKLRTLEEVQHHRETLALNNHLVPIKIPEQYPNIDNELRELPEVTTTHKEQEK